MVEAADSFDDEPDHGLHEPQVRDAWCELLAKHLPAAPCEVLDLGCGTGTLSVLLASLGYIVTGVDFSAGMLARATAKANREHVEVAFVQGDAAAPPVTRLFDVLLCRHVLWALPEPEDVLQRWRSLLRPGGRLVLIEGHWSTGVGMTAAELVAQVERVVGPVVLARLPDVGLWGREIGDERYLVSVLR
ncbi:MAG: class I SAM-dependent methyltransferase [Mycobacteriales bacterium]